MRKFLATLVAAATIYSGSAAAHHQHINGYGYGNSYFHNHHWNNYHYHGHSGGVEWVIPLIGGLMIGGMIANSHRPHCQTVYVGQQWDGWQWVNVYQRICR